MPWTAAQASSKTHKADTAKKRKQWADVADNILARTGDEGRAIRGANSVVARHAKGGRVDSSVIRAALVEPMRIVSRYDVPYGAGRSKDGKQTYVDRHIPRNDPKLRLPDGKQAVLWKYLDVHEKTEWAAMERLGMSYERAHHDIATTAERTVVERDGLDWKEYERVVDGYLAKVEHEKPVNPPPDLYLKPYPHDKAELLRRAGRDKGRKSMNHFAFGGVPKASTPHVAGFITRSIGRQMEPRAGLIRSTVPGRTDRLPMSVKPHSYVVPADVVSGAGQGNTLAGADLLHQAFKTGPYGTSLPKGGGRSTIPKAPRVGSFAEGGDAGDVDIVAAGGEFVIEPEDVERIGGGDMKRGHDLLDAMVHRIRKHTAKRLLKLPGPKK